MATNALNCTPVGQTYGYTQYIYDYNTTNIAYAGYNGSNYYAYILKFTTPNFTGASESLTVSMYANIGVNANPTLRYAVCTSDSNKNNYLGASGAVTDANQIATGTVNFWGLTSEPAQKSITVSVTGLTANKTYYLILWADAQTGVSINALNSTWGSLIMSIAYNEGVVYIDNGTSFDAYQVYIDNGSSWDLYIPYIDNGSGWDIIG